MSPLTRSLRQRTWVQSCNHTTTGSYSLQTSLTGAFPPATLSLKAITRVTTLPSSLNTSQESNHTHKSVCVTEFLLKAGSELGFGEGWSSTGGVDELGVCDVAFNYFERAEEADCEDCGQEDS